MNDPTPERDFIAISHSRISIGQQHAFDAKGSRLAGQPGVIRSALVRRQGMLQPSGRPGQSAPLLRGFSSIPSPWVPSFHKQIIVAGNYNKHAATLHGVALWRSAFLVLLV